MRILNKINPSFIKAYEYSKQEHELRIEFGDGHVESYDVDQATFYELNGSPSKGTVFHKKIKGKEK